MTTREFGVRQAALVMYAAAPAERSWLLSQLAPDEQHALSGMLEELTRLGLPADARLLQAAAHLEAEPRKMNKDSSHAQMVSRLQAMSASSLIEILHTEPVVLIALVLRSTEWDWQAMLLRRLDPLKKIAVEKRLADPAPFPSALTDAVLAAIMTNIQTTKMAMTDDDINASNASTGSSQAGWRARLSNLGGNRGSSLASKSVSKLVSKLASKLSSKPQQTRDQLFKRAKQKGAA